MSKSLLVFSIAPVQPFIAQARRAQDLAVGSQLLSRLMQAALEVVEQEGGKLLYPVLPGDESVETGLPNKLVARLTDGHGEEIAQACEQAVRKKWREIMGEAQDNLIHLVPPDTGWRAIWQRQVESLPEIYWSLTPWPTSDEVRRFLGQNASLGYSSVYTIASHAFEARKALRDAFPSEEPDEKCSVCGQRSALHRSEETAREYWKEVTKFVTAAKLRPGGRERLCAICAAKRFSKLGRVAFPSVSHMAAASFKARLLDLMQKNTLPKKLMAALAEHQAMVCKLGLYTISERTIPFLFAEAQRVGGGWQSLAQGLLRCDGDVLFPETFTPKRLEDSYGIAVMPEKVEEVARARWKTVNLLKAAAEAGIEPPGRYYAILMLDGDRMGQNLAAVQCTEEHRAISTALARFAREDVRSIVEEKRPGRVIYAGGDDVLALLPVEDALKAAAELSQAYQRAMAGKLKTPTVSASVLIVHHLHPLDVALQAVRQAEHTAKEAYGRDAVVVHLLKRSGGDIIAGAGWADKGGVEIAKWVDDVVKRFARRQLSPKLAHLVCAEANTLTALPKDAQRAELRRLCMRQAGEDISHEEKEKKEQAEKLSGEMVTLTASIEARRKGSEEDDQASSLEIVARWLLIAAFIARPGGEE